MASRRVIEPQLYAEYTDLADGAGPALREAADALSAHYQVPYDGLWINFYRDATAPASTATGRPASAPTASSRC